MIGPADDLVSVGADLVRLIRARQVAAAIERVNEQLSQSSDLRYAADAQKIAALSLAIKATEDERRRVLEEVDKLPSEQRRFAALELKPLVDRLFSDEIARLRSEKRKASRGA